MNINWKEIKELELNNMGAWPVPMVILLTIFISLFILFMGYWFDIKSQFERLDYSKSEEMNLKASFVKKVQQAVNLPAYKLQLINMKKTFGGLLRQLPEQTEVPALLEDISHQGLATGLEFQSIRLKPERVMDFYVELPIEISVIGTYQQFAEFISNVSALPRIVTLHDFVIQSPVLKKDQNTDPSKDQNKNLSKEPNAAPNLEKLVMSITAKTYRYIAEAGNNVTDRDHKK